MARSAEEEKDYKEYKVEEDAAKQYLAAAHKLVVGKTKALVQADTKLKEQLTQAIDATMKHGHAAERLRADFTVKWKDSNFDQHNDGKAGHGRAVSWIDENIFVPVKILQAYL